MEGYVVGYKHCEREVIFSGMKEFLRNPKLKKKKKKRECTCKTGK